MATYYDALGVPSDAPREEIERAIERTAARLRQMGQWEQQRDLFRKIENILLTPDLRRQYDIEVALRGVMDTATKGTMPAATAEKPEKGAAARAGGKEAARKGVRRGLILTAAGVLALGVAYGGWFLYSRFATRVDPGVYLLNETTGEVVAVVLERDPQHLFPGNTRSSRAVLVYLIGQKKAAWLGEAMVEIEFREGDPAPEALLAEGREAAKAQDAHQSLR